MHTYVHPFLIDRLKRAASGGAAYAVHIGCGTAAEGCGPAEADPKPCGPGLHGMEFAAGFEGGQFGVRRPLRFLAYKLGLSEPQVSEMARILNDLKTERAQSAVDDR